MNNEWVLLLAFLAVVAVLCYGLYRLVAAAVARSRRD